MKQSLDTEVIFNNEARQKLLEGIDILANAVKVTLGGNGRNVIIGSNYNSPRITKDGVTVAKSIQPKGEIRAIGAALIKEVADKTVQIAGDGTIQDYYAFSMKWLNAIKPFMQDKNAVYFFNGDTKMREFLNALNDAGYYFSQLLIWNKCSAVMGRKDYQPMHELIFYGWYGKHKYFGSKDKSILQCPKPKANKLHPTMKPPQLLRKLIYHSSEAGNIVYEPFAGSGSTMVACEQLGRICYMIEMDVKYCEVIIKRYIQLCKELKKEAIVTINGKPLNE